MSWSFDPSAWTTATKPSVANFQNIATDLHTLGGNKDGARYGYANNAFATLVPQELPGTAYTVTAGSWAAGVATLTIGAHNIKANQLIVIASVTPSGYNNGGVEVAATSVTGTQVLYPLAVNPGAWTSGGTVTAWGTPANGMLAVAPGGVLNLYASGAFSPVSGSSNFPNSSAFNSAVQAIANNTETALTYDTNTFDVGPVHSTSTNPTRFTCPASQGGIYMATGNVRFAASATGSRYLAIRKNGTTYLAIQWQYAIQATFGNGVNASALVSLAATDYIEFFAFQDSGGSLNTVAGAGFTAGSLIRII